MSSLAGQIECPRCGLRTSLAGSECAHCGAPVDRTLAPSRNPTAGSAPAVPSIFQWRYYRRPGDAASPIYIQKYETWTEVASNGLRFNLPGPIPAMIMCSLEEVPRLQAEVERREQAFRRNPVQSAGESGAWRLKLLLALPGIPVTAAYLFALLWFTGLWPSGGMDTAGLLFLTAGPAFIGAFASSLLWASEAGDDAWWVGGLLGAIVLVPDGFVFAGGAEGFLWGAFVHTMLGTFFFLALVGFVLGCFAGWPAQLVADDLRRKHQQGRFLRLETRNIALDIAGLGVVLAVVAGVLRLL